ncbi:MAG: hypothetical protein AB7V13_06320, partial [Pseudorhodoplanes sp.]
MTEYKEVKKVTECAAPELPAREEGLCEPLTKLGEGSNRGDDATNKFSNMLAKGSLDSVLREVRQETKGLNRKNVVPFLGTDAELVEAYEKHQEWQRVNQLDDARYVPEPFRKRQLRLTSAGELLDADVPPRETMLWPWFKVGDAAMIYAPAGL